jgi:hypothetical protein
VPQWSSRISRNCPPLPFRDELEAKTADIRDKTSIFWYYPLKLVDKVKRSGEETNIIYNCAWTRHLYLNHTGATWRVGCTWIRHWSTGVMGQR